MSSERDEIIEAYNHLINIISLASIKAITEHCKNVDVLTSGIHTPDNMVKFLLSEREKVLNCIDINVRSMLYLIENGEIDKCKDSQVVSSSFYRLKDKLPGFV